MNKKWNYPAPETFFQFSPVFGDNSKKTVDWPDLLRFLFCSLPLKRFDRRNLFFNVALFILFRWSLLPHAVNENGSQLYRDLKAAVSVSSISALSQLDERARRRKKRFFVETDQQHVQQLGLVLMEGILAVTREYLDFIIDRVLGNENGPKWGPFYRKLLTVADSSLNPTTRQVWQQQEQEWSRAFPGSNRSRLLSSSSSDSVTLSGSVSSLSGSVNDRRQFRSLLTETDETTQNLWSSQEKPVFRFNPSRFWNQLKTELKNDWTGEFWDPKFLYGHFAGGLDPDFILLPPEYQFLAQTGEGNMMKQKWERISREWLAMLGQTVHAEHDPFFIPIPRSSVLPPPATVNTEMTSPKEKRFPDCVHFLLETPASEWHNEERLFLANFCAAVFNPENFTTWPHVVAWLQNQSYLTETNYESLSSANQRNLEGIYKSARNRYMTEQNPNRLYGCRKNIQNTDQYGMNPGQGIVCPHAASCRKKAGKEQKEADIEDLARSGCGSQFGRAVQKRQYWRTPADVILESTKVFM